MKWRKYLPLVGLAIFAYILIKIGVADILSEIGKADFALLGIAVLFLPILFFTQTLKWFYIARKQKINVPLGEAFKINLITFFYGFITPSKLGTIIRADYLKKYTKNIGKGLSNFVLDKVFDIGSVFFLAIVFSFIFKDILKSFQRLYIIIILLVFICVVIVFMNKKRAKFFLGFFYRKLIPLKLKEKVKLTFDSFYEDMPKKRYFVWFFFLNIINWAVIYFIAFIIGLAVGIQLNFIYFLAIMPIGTIVSLIPITMNGLGTREAVLITLFGLFGVSAGKVFSMSILDIIITSIIPSIAGSFLSFKRE